MKRIADSLEVLAERVEFQEPQPQPQPLQFDEDAILKEILRIDLL